MRVIEFPSVVMLDFRTGAIPEAHATVGPALNDSDERRAAHCPGFAGAKFVLGDFFRGRRFPPVAAARLDGPLSPKLYPAEPPVISFARTGHSAPELGDSSGRFASAAGPPFLMRRAPAAHQEAITAW
jgi:hypothetical protein